MALIRSFALACALALAACASPARAQQDAMASLAPLIGCWRGAFEGVADIHDERCFEPMLGGAYMRDVHAVRPTDYAGETIYYFDATARMLAFTYYASNGGISRGVVVAEGGALVFPPHTFVGADGSEHRLRSVWRFDGPDRFVVESERQEGGIWRPFGRITYARAPA